MRTKLLYNLGFLLVLLTSCKAQTASNPRNDAPIERGHIYSGRPDTTDGVTGYTFPELAGPATTTVIPAEVRTSVARYHRGGLSRLALYVSDSASNWLAL